MEQVLHHYNAVLTDDMQIDAYVLLKLIFSTLKMVLSNLNRGGIDIIVLTAKKYVILILVIGDKMVGVSVENAVLHLPGESFRTFAFQFTFVGSSPSDFAFLCHSHPFIWLIFYHQ